MTQEKFVRVGIVGVGNIGSAHASAVYGGKIAHMKLCALCDSDPHRAEQLRDTYPDVPVFESAEKMLSEAELDAVVISTPHYDHPTLAIGAFERGLHVLTEKPAGVYCSAVREAVRAAKDADRVFAIMFNQRANKLFRRAKELVESGELGELVRNVWIITNWYRKQAYYDSGDWRASWRGEGGGVLMNQAPHNLDLWQWICGMPEEIRAECTVGRFHNIEVEDEATLFARYANGATGTFITSTGDYPGTNRLEITGTRGKLVIENKKLTLWKLSDSERNYCLTPEGGEKLGFEVTEELDEPYCGHHTVLERFARSILFGDAPIAYAEEGLAQLTLCNAAYLSSWQGRAVRLPLDDGEYLCELEKRIESGRKIEYRPSERAHSHEYKSRWDTNW